ncbi:MAG: hypothetical protein QW569_06665 [Candidatus Bathyarchaeia archaeon]|nr:hypothetical protein [Candidatus Bathyarchaeota archaeon]
MKALKLINVRLAGSALLLLIMLAAGLTANAQPAKTVTTTFRWERTLEIGGSEMPLKISIPVILSVAGLPDKAQPGETFQLRVELTPSEGAFIQLSDKTVNIDALVIGASGRPYEVDLSRLKPLAPLVITRLLEEELKMPHEAAESLSSAVQDNVRIILTSEMRVGAEVAGAAAMNPREVSMWFNEASPQTLKISQNAREGDEIEISYFVDWGLTLKIDLSGEVYSDPTAGPVMKKLAQLIGLPLNRALGGVRGDERLTHEIQVYAPYRLTFETVLAGAGLAAAAASIIIIMLVKYPRKPSWR